VTLSDANYPQTTPFSTFCIVFHILVAIDEQVAASSLPLVVIVVDAFVEVNVRWVASVASGSAIKQ